jgi:hypothetical protein
MLEEIMFGKWVFFSPNMLEAAQDKALSFQCILRASPGVFQIAL